MHEMGGFSSLFFTEMIHKIPLEFHEFSASFTGVLITDELKVLKMALFAGYVFW